MTAEADHRQLAEGQEGNTAHQVEAAEVFPKR